MSAQQVKPRKFRIVRRQRGFVSQVLLTVDGKSALYNVMPDSEHPAWLLGQDGQSRSYCVTVDAESGNSCECDGFRFRRKCKHIDLVRSLIEKGELIRPRLFGETRPPPKCEAVAGPAVYEWDE